MVSDLSAVMLCVRVCDVLAWYRLFPSVPSSQLEIFSVNAPVNPVCSQRPGCTCHAVQVLLGLLAGQEPDQLPAESKAINAAFIH